MWMEYLGFGILLPHKHRDVQMVVVNENCYRDAEDNGW